MTMFFQGLACFPSMQMRMAFPMVKLESYQVLLCACLLLPLQPHPVPLSLEPHWTRFSAQHYAPLQLQTWVHAISSHASFLHVILLLLANFVSDEMSLPQGICSDYPFPTQSSSQRASVVGFCSLVAI